MTKRPGETPASRTDSLTLLEAPLNIPLRVTGLLGGENVRRRLLSMGFHTGDLIELNNQAIFRGPVLVRNLTSGSTVALGRVVARRILVEVMHERG